MCVTNTTSRRAKSLEVAARIAASAAEASNCLASSSAKGARASTSLTGVVCEKQQCHSFSHEEATRSAEPLEPRCSGRCTVESSDCSASGKASLLSEAVTAHICTQSLSCRPNELSSCPKKRRRRGPQPPGLTAKQNIRHFVHHNYHDHADEVPVDFSEITKSMSSEHFPFKLHEMLSNAEKQGFDHMVHWQPHGRCFIIHKPKEFAESIMPLYFKQTKLTSFQRQLNLYGFQRITQGADNRGYYNEYFLRGRPHLCRHMSRTKVKGTKFKAASSPDQEPNFYLMPPLSDIPSNSTMRDEDEPVGVARGDTALVSYSQSLPEHVECSLPESNLNPVPSGSSQQVQRRANPTPPTNVLLPPGDETSSHSASLDQMFDPPPPEQTQQNGNSACLSNDQNYPVPRSNADPSTTPGSSPMEEERTREKRTCYPVLDQVFEEIVPQAHEDPLKESIQSWCAGSENACLMWYDVEPADGEAAIETDAQFADLLESAICDAL